jgi:hypothetical protein
VVSAPLSAPRQRKSIHEGIVPINHSLYHLSYSSISLPHTLALLLPLPPPLSPISLSVCVCVWRGERRAYTGQPTTGNNH